MKDPHGPRNAGRYYGKTRNKMDVMYKDWLLVPFLLLCLRDEGSYGYRLEERLGELGFSSGSRTEEMYRTLWRMEREGKVLCDREGGGFRLPQRWFELTEAGEDHLRYWADSLAEHREKIELFFRLYDEPSEQARSYG